MKSQAEKQDEINMNISFFPDSAHYLTTLKAFVSFSNREHSRRIGKTLLLEHGLTFAPFFVQLY